MAKSMKKRTSTKTLSSKQMKKTKGGLQTAAALSAATKAKLSYGA